ncbi:MAG: hypothetical protein IMY83_02655 [Chloroflexi bacterium]|nr:hypothetical protein [Chloroflexota bacterium]
MANRAVRQKHLPAGRGRKISMKALLILTNLRLIWVRRKELAEEAFRFAFDFYLQEIDRVSITGTIFRHIVVAYEIGDEVFHLGDPLTGGITSLHEYCRVVNRLVAQRKREIDEAKTHRRDIMHRPIISLINPDYGSLQELMEERGVALKVHRCPTCGAKTAIPQQGNTMFCEHCRSPISFTEVSMQIDTIMDGATA